MANGSRAGVGRAGVSLAREETAVMAEVIDTRPKDDRYVVWVCPTHGIVDEGELAEGVDFAAGIGMDGDVAWTDRFYCQREHSEGEAHEVALVDVREDVQAACASDEEERS
jgi:hypothetical protein